MTFDTVHEMADFVGAKHSRFAGHSTYAPFGYSCRVFDALMRAVDYIRKEPACSSVSFDAVVAPTLTEGAYLPTLITVSLDGEKFALVETVNEEA